MLEKNILEALQKGVTAAVAASVSPNLPVKYVGLLFNKPASGGWLEILYIPNNIQAQYWAEGKTYRGILRLLLHWPMDGKGVYEPMQVLKSVSAYFEKGQKLVDPENIVQVSITDHPNLLNVLEEPPELLLPLSIRYHFFKA